jgi:hypothetical protein
VIGERNRILNLMARAAPRAATSQVSPTSRPTTSVRRTPRSCSPRRRTRAGRRPTSSGPSGGS